MLLIHSQVHDISVRILSPGFVNINAISPVLLIVSSIPGFIRAPLHIWQLIHFTRKGAFYARNAIRTLFLLSRRYVRSSLPCVLLQDPDYVLMTHPFI